MEEKKPDREIQEFERKKAIARAIFPFEKAKVFKFKALDPDGKEISGFVRAKSKDSAVKGLLGNNYTVKEIQETSIDVKQISPIVLNPLAVQEAVTIFTRQLLVLYRSGIPLERAVSILFVQTKEKHLKQALSKMYIDMVKGTSFKKTLSRHPHVFPEDYIAMIEAGEKSGQLAYVLEQLADLQEKNLATLKKLQSAMTYPFTVMFFTLLVNYAVFKWVLPNFVDIFNNMDMELPVLTKIIIAIVEFMQTPWFWVSILICLFVVVMIIARIMSEPHVRRIADEILLSIPWIGKLIRQVVFIRTFRVFATMLSSGVTVSNALKSVSRTSRNQVYYSAFKNMVSLVERGSSLPDCFEREKSLFPMIVRQMILIGDETGEPEITMNLMADFYEAELDHALESISVFVEPFLIGIMGIIVGFVVLAIFVPIYNMITTLG